MLHLWLEVNVDAVWLVLVAAIGAALYPYWGAQAFTWCDARFALWWAPLWLVSVHTLLHLMYHTYAWGLSPLASSCCCRELRLVNHGICWLQVSSASCGMCVSDVSCWLDEPRLRGTRSRPT